MKVLLITLFYAPFLCMAQISTQPVHEGKVYIDSLGHYYQQAALPVYLFVANSRDGKPIQLKSETGQEIKRNK